MHTAKIIVKRSPEFKTNLDNAIQQSDDATTNVKGLEHIYSVGISNIITIVTMAVSHYSWNLNIVLSTAIAVIILMLYILGYRNIIQPIMRRLILLVHKL